MCCNWLHTYRLFSVLQSKELVTLILDSLDLEDVLNVAQTCSFMWWVCAYVIVKHYRKIVRYSSDRVPFFFTYESHQTKWVISVKRYFWLTITLSFEYNRVAHCHVWWFKSSRPFSCCSNMHLHSCCSFLHCQQMPAGNIETVHAKRTATREVSSHFGCHMRCYCRILRSQHAVGNTLLSD